MIKKHVSSSSLNRFVAVVYVHKLRENWPKHVITQCDPSDNATNQDKICELRCSHWEIVIIEKTAQGSLLSLRKDKQTNKKRPSPVLKVVFLHSWFSPHSIFCILAPHSLQGWASQQFILTLVQDKSASHLYLKQNAIHSHLGYLLTWWIQVIAY